MSNDRQVPRFLPSRPPSGTDNFGNLFRDPALLLQQLAADELVHHGFDDLRPALLAVGQHVAAEGTRITELAERAWLSKATVVHSVDELERLGYARRAPDPLDGRAKLVLPTARARAAERVVGALAVEIRDAWAAQTGEQEMAQLEAGLRHLRAVLWPQA